MSRNPFEHHHSHDYIDEDDNLEEQLDPAQQSMADALRVSFFLLKIAMLIVFILYLCSGMFNVKEGERAVVLHFGEITGESGAQVLKPGGPYFAFPFPIDRVERVDISQRDVQLLKSFWFALQGEESRNPASIDAMAGNPGPLNPEKDGSLITGDANIVHARWTVTYEIPETSVQTYLENRPEPRGEGLKLLKSNDKNRTEAIQMATDDLVVAAVEKGIVHAVARVRADDFVKGMTMQGTAVKHAQESLDRSKLGVRIVNLTAKPTTFPLSVRSSVGNVTTAESGKAKAIEEAQKYRTQVPSAAAGDGYPQVLKLVKEYELTLLQDNPEKLAELDEKLGDAFETLVIETPEGPRKVTGMASDVIKDAQAYSQNVVEHMKAEAEAFVGTATTAGALERYRDNPKVFLNRRWQGAVEMFLNAKNAEYMWLTGKKWIDLNTHPDVRRKREAAAIEVNEQGR